MTVLIKWLRNRYQRVVGSIAFLPALISLLFLALALGMVWFDFSHLGKNIKSRLHWLSLQDATTARSIISAIVTGIISLSVFSFSMVMIILNQTASNMSNRILDKVIGNRFQQVVLGFYTGSIVYALFLLSTIRDINKGVHIPALSTYLLIAITILDIFLFIYFLDFVTQSVKYETIIRRIARQTHTSMEKACWMKNPETPVCVNDGLLLLARQSGLLQKVHTEDVVAFCSQHQLCLAVLHPLGSFILEGVGYLKLTGAGINSWNDGQENTLHALFDIGQGHSINNNYHYGFHQLMEVAVKALSPGINDPGTAVESLHAIIALLHFRLQHHPQANFYDHDKELRLVLNKPSFDQLFEDTMAPIWHYGRKDPVVLHSLNKMLPQLAQKEAGKSIRKMLCAIEKERAQAGSHFPV